MCRVKSSDMNFNCSKKSEKNAKEQHMKIETKRAIFDVFLEHDESVDWVH